MGFADRIKRQDVINAKKLAAYCQQETGIPYPSGNQFIVVNVAIKNIFENYPQATYLTLCAIVDWSKKNNRRYAHVGNLLNKGLRYAYLEGYLPELDPRNHPGDLHNLMIEAYNSETNEYWKDRLLRGDDPNIREAIYEEWLRYTESTDSAGNASTPT